MKVRVPFLDHVFAELTFTIPSNLKYKSNFQKYILIKSMAQYLEPEIINHKKNGFVVPLAQWFKHDLLEYMTDKLHPSNPIISQFFHIPYIEDIKKIHLTGSRDFNNKLWSLLFFDTWYEHNFQA